MDLQYPKFHLRPLSYDDANDLNFTYNLLKKRFETNTKINIRDYVLPSFDEHVAMLHGNRFKHYYVVSCDGIEFMTIYIIAASTEVGFFIDPFKWEHILKQRRKKLLSVISDVPKDASESKRMAAYCVKQALLLLLQKHNDLKDTICASVAEENKFSRFTTRYCGFIPKSTRYKLCTERVNWSLTCDNHTIRPLDVSSEEDVSFTYELLKMRFNHDHINIHNDMLPTREQHKQVLQSNRYRYYYICSYKDVDVLAMYVIDKGPELGAFINTNNLFYTIKKYSDSEYWKKVEAMPKNTSKSWQISAYHGQIFFNKLLLLHPELVDTLESTINAKNEWSKHNTEALGFKPIYTLYEYPSQ